MAGPGQIIGRVSVKVLPDTSDFRRDAQRKLNRLEKGLKIEVGTKLNMAGASAEALKEVQKINQRNRMSDARKIRLYTTIDRSAGPMRVELNKAINQMQNVANGHRRVKIRLDAVAGIMEAELDKQSLKRIEKQLKDWRDRMSPLKIEVKPNLVVGSTTWIEKRLDYLTRPRLVPILPYLKSTAVAKVSQGIGALIARLSGGRLAWTWIDNLWSSLKNLDKSVPIIGGVGLAISGLAGIAITSVSNLAALSFTLAQIGAVVATLPATFAATAIGVGTLIAVFKDFNTVLPNVQAQLSKLQDSMSAKFWAKAKDPIKDLIDSILPAFTTGLNNVSTAFGSFFAEFAGRFKSFVGPELPAMFNGLVTGIQNAQGAAAPLASTIKTLGSIGAQYLPQMGAWVAQTAAKFDLWLGSMASNGSLQTWIDNGLVALSDLGRVLSNLGGIFAGIGRAAAAGGGSTLGVFADTLERIHDVIDTPAFQSGLANVFASAHAAISSLVSTAGPAFEKFMGTIPELMNQLMPVAGEAIGGIVAALSTALANPAFQTGLVNLFEGINQAVMALAPAMGPIATALGALGTSLSVFLTAVGPTLGTLLGTLGTALAQLLPALNPIISILGNSLGSIMTALAPAFMMVVGAVGNLATAFIPFLNTLMGALMPVLAQIIPMVGSLLANALNTIVPILPMIAGLFAQIVPLIGQLLMALMPVVEALLPALAAILGAIIPVISAIVSAVLPPLIVAVQALVAALVPVINVIAQIVVWLLEKLTPVFVFVAGLLVSVVTGIIGGITSIFDGILGIWEGFKTMFSGGVGNFFTGLGQIINGAWNIIKGIFMVALNVGILGAVKKGWTLIKGVFTASWNAIKLNAKVAWELLKRLPGQAFSAIKSSISRALSTIKTDIQLGWSMVKQYTVTAFNNMKSTISTKLGEAVALLRGLPGRVTSALGNLGSTLINAGRQLISGLISGITQKFGDVKAKLGELTSKFKDWKGPESLDRVLLVEAGRLIIQGLINGMESKYDGVRRSLQGLTADIGATTIQGPQIADVSGTYASINGALAARGAEVAGAAGFAPSIKVEMPPSNLSPEDVADAILHAQRKFAYGSAYSY